MNAEKRKIINAQLEKLEDIQGSIESLQSEEQDCYNNLPEALQSSEKGEAFSAAADLLQNAVDSISEVMNYLEEAVSQ